MPARYNYSQDFLRAAIGHASTVCPSPRQDNRRTRGSHPNNRSPRTTPTYYCFLSSPRLSRYCMFTSLSLLDCLQWFVLLRCRGLTLEVATLRHDECEACVTGGGGIWVYWTRLSHAFNTHPSMRCDVWKSFTCLKWNKLCLFYIKATRSRAVLIYYSWLLCGEISIVVVVNRRINRVGKYNLICPNKHKNLSSAPKKTDMIMNAWRLLRGHAGGTPPYPFAPCSGRERVILI